MSFSTVPGEFGPVSTQRPLFYSLCFTGQLSSLSPHLVLSELQHLRALNPKMNQEMFDLELHFTSDIFYAPLHAHKRQI